MNGEELQTIETRWGFAIRAMFDTEQSRDLAPDPSLWPAYLNGTTSAAGYFRPPLGKTDEISVIVRVNHGVWQTVCPFCPSAQHASRDDPWFYCAACHNERINGQAIPVVWPDDHPLIDDLLLKVDLVGLRNWEPHETTDELADQVTNYIDARENLLVKPSPFVVVAEPKPVDEP